MKLANLHILRRIKIQNILIEVKKNIFSTFFDGRLRLFWSMEMFFITYYVPFSLLMTLLYILLFICVFFCLPQISDNFMTLKYFF